MAAAALMTFLDWRLNPSGIFRSAEGTHWSIVLKTGMSWFLPVFLLVGVVALLVTKSARRRSRAEGDKKQT